MSDVVVPMVGSCLLLVFGIMMYRGKLTGLLAGMSSLSGGRLEEEADGRVSRHKPSGGGGYSFLRNMSPFSSLFPDKRAIFGLMVAAVIIAALAYVNRESIRMYIKAKRNPGHRNPR